MTEPEHVARNRVSRERLAALIPRLGERTVVLSGGWTAAAVLAHLAFWDRVAAARLEKYLRHGKGMEFFNDVFFEYINEAALPQWTGIPLGIAAADAVAAAEAADRFLADLSEDDHERLRALARPRLLDRSGHRNEHLDELERGLG